MEPPPLYAGRSSTPTARRSEANSTLGTGTRASHAVVGARADGGFVVAWEGGDGNAEGIRAQLFDADGNASGSALQVNTTTAGSQIDPTITALANGDVVLAWTDFSVSGDDQSFLAVRAQVLHADGGGEEFLLTRRRPMSSSCPRSPAWPMAALLRPGQTRAGARGIPIKRRCAARSSTPMARGPAPNSWSTPRPHSRKISRRLRGSATAASSCLAGRRADRGRLEPGNPGAGLQQRRDKVERRISRRHDRLAPVRSDRDGTSGRALRARLVGRQRNPRRYLRPRHPRPDLRCAHGRGAYQRHGGRRRLRRHRFRRHDARC